MCDTRSMKSECGRGGGRGAKQAVFKTLKTVHKFAFSRISTKAHEISEIMRSKGEKR